MRILLAEDERSLSRAVTALLERNHYAVGAVYDGAEALDYLEGGNYDALILDIMMPKVDGLEVLRRLRERGNAIPVLMLTAKGEVEDKVLGLDSGANDYLTKPFATAELLARLRAMTRQSVQLSSRLTFGSLCLDQTTFELSTPSGSFRLANKEYQMMELFLRNPRQIIPTERFLERIWGYDSEVEVSVVWVYISYLRKKLAALQADVEIRASRNLGYSLALVLLVILGGVNAMSYRKIVQDAGHILELLSENRGAFPKALPPDGETGKPDRPLPPGNGLSPEAPFESRFFSVLLDGEGQVLQSDTGQIAAVDDQSAGEMAQAVWETGHTGGFWEDYRYVRVAENGGVRFIFLDCGRSLSNFRTTLLASVLVALSGLLAVFLLLLVLSRRIVRPVAESYEKQRRFITDAGHELKTPLTIIGADLDLVEPELEGNEWLQDIRCQVRRLAGLTQDLIYLSRMEEETPPIQPIEFPLSDLTEEMAQSFQGLAKAQGKGLVLSIQPMLSYTGDENAIRQLLSILLDNALKYTPDDGEVEIALKKEGRMIRLSVSNTIDRPMEREMLDRLFDRFYRGDQSRSSQTGGYGLGLSIAKGIVLAHRGKIRAESSGASLSVIVSLPV